jgi:hypothetical protein
MLALTSEKWRELKHAYGAAGDIPSRLQAVYDNPYDGTPSMDETWTDLWSSLCHQGDINSASTAAVPHLVEAALLAKPGILHWSIIDLPVAIAESLEKRPHQLRANEIDDSFFDSILRLEEVCARTVAKGRPVDLTKAVRAARRLLAGRIGGKLPKQKSDFGPLFGFANEP